MRRLAVVLAAGLTVAGATAGCAVAPASVAPSRSVHVPAPPAGPVRALALKNLPLGVFYLLAGPHVNDLNVWEVSSAGVQEQLTHNAPGYEIDGMAASPKGIILADSLHMLDQLARWTNHGPAWLHPPGHLGDPINGQVPDIGRDGKIGYLLPPHDGGGSMNSKDFTVWLRQSFTGSQKIVYKSKTFPGRPYLGPLGQIAIVPPTNPLPRGQHPAIFFISRSGAVRSIRTPRQSFYDAWGQQAPALVVSYRHGPAQAIYPGGQRESLPVGWLPLAWNAAGTNLLVESATMLGTWTPSHPKYVTPAAAISKGYEITQASWLRKPARLGT